MHVNSDDQKVYEFDFYVREQELRGSINVGSILYSIGNIIP